MPQGETLDLRFVPEARTRLMEYDSPDARYSLYSYKGQLVIPGKDAFSFRPSRDLIPALEFVDPVNAQTVLEPYPEPDGTMSGGSDGHPPRSRARGTPWYRFPPSGAIHTYPKDLVCFRPNIDAPEISDSQYSSVDGMQFPNLTTFAIFNSIYGLSQHSPKSESVDMSRDKTLIHRSGLTNGMRFKHIEPDRWLPNERLYLDIPRDTDEYRKVLEATRLLSKNAFVPLILKSRRTINKYPKDVRNDIISAMNVWGLAINAAGTHTFVRAGNTISVEKIQVLAT